MLQYQISYDAHIVTSMSSKTVRTFDSEAELCNYYGARLFTDTLIDLLALRLQDLALSPQLADRLKWLTDQVISNAVAKRLTTLP